jgi:hypothetical protein
MGWDDEWQAELEAELAEENAEFEADLLEDHDGFEFEDDTESDEVEPYSVDTAPAPPEPSTPTIPRPVERALKIGFALEVIHQLTGWRPPH